MGAGRCLVGTMASLLSPFFLASLLVAVVKAEIRCYCNTPTCVTTGYMCKSELGICYSDLLGDYRKHSPPEHGCIDHRPESRSPVLCPDGAAEGSSRDWPMVQCCTEDMCNYNDHPGIPFQTSSDRTDHERQNDWSPVGPDEQLPSSSAIWFRAAVIAVPITGAVILTFLVFVAIRMLRNEDKRHRKRHQILSALHRGYPYSQKTFISVRTQDIEKESTAASSNCVTSSSSFSASETKNSSSSHPNVTLVHWEQCNVTDSIDVI
ncbi:BMP and activin membrane-bound inhibitor homolog [Branchiostoma floridae x Branchiostoma belcheri]